uniref:BD-FAE-like domain-containing protein n=1 Tax=Grammatophora oceanica TaxID=210454 RepID=A0A7S1Y375_9STRA|mmetsp:Transcript_16267/g.24091  ORF Transcript_16267/g.24091 Transcript_16267/m.24091 type:complete len:394 (+) Transcript_16267:270-1451(+)
MVWNQLTTTTTTTTRKRKSRQLLISELEEAEKNLPPLPDPHADPNDDFFRFLRRKLPVSVVHWMRDSGFSRWLQDTLLVFGIPAVLKAYPAALANFLHLSGVFVMPSSLSKKKELGDTDVSFKTVSYGSHPRQRMDCITLDTKSSHSNKPWIVFCHGGAWGSGQPWMYRLAALPFLAEGYNVCVWGYRTYPDGNVADQQHDLAMALQTLRQKYDPSHVAVVGHSSGSHIALMTALTKPSSTSAVVDTIILLSGVYDICAHYEWETARGIDELSPMKPACGTHRSAWQEVSPTLLLQPSALDDLVSTKASINTEALPPILILHGINDKVVPYTSAINVTKAFYGIDEDQSNVVQLQLLPTGHAELVLELMMGHGVTRSHVMGWLARYVDGPSKE